MSVGQYVPISINPKLKAWSNHVRSMMIRRFLAFGPEKLVDTLRSLGICAGDTVLAHTSFANFEGFTGGISEAIQVLQTAVGKEGNLLLPTFPFSGSAYEYIQSHQLTNIARTPSKMGFMTEIFRRLPDVTRSIHPTHPVAAWGKRARELTADHYKALTPCGKGSPFYHLLKADGKILLAGVDIRSMTFFHYAEEQLEPEMPFSPFTATWFNLETRGTDGQIYQTRTRLFDPAISSRRDVRLMIEPLRNAGFWRERTVGLLKLVVLSTTEILETLQFMSKNGRYCYVFDR